MLDPTNGQAACEHCHEIESKREREAFQASRSRRRPPYVHPGMARAANERPAGC